MAALRSGSDYKVGVDLPSFAMTTTVLQPDSTQSTPRNESVQNKQTAPLRYDQGSFDEMFGYRPVSDRLWRNCWRSVRKQCPCGAAWLLGRVFSFVPIVHWLPRYRWRKDFLSDLIAGLTIGVLHIPQSMAYAILAGVEPIYGLYTSFFPPLVYMIFGSSRHVSVGVFAVVALMTGTVRYRILPDDHHGRGVHHINGTGEEDAQGMTPTNLRPIEVDAALMLTVGIMMIAMGVLRLDALTTLLSDAVVKGFTTGAGVHVFTFQLDKVIGVRVPRRQGIFRLLRSWADLASACFHTNLLALAISVAVIAFLAVGKEFVAPILRERTAIPVPWDLIAMMVITAASYFLDFRAHGVSIVGEIPTGLPSPKIPKLELIADVAADAFGIAVVSMAVAISLGKMFAKKNDYKLDNRQEFYAIGVMEVICSVFSCFPASPALARTMVYTGAGVRTQLAAVFSSGLLLVVILALAPLLRTLPLCVLSAIILVALKGLFIQLKELPKVYSISKTDCAIWLFGMSMTILLDVREGFVCALLFALLTVVLRSIRPRTALLGCLEGNYFKDRKRYMKASAPPSGLSIFRFEFSLLFMNADLFQEKLYEAVGVDVADARKWLRKRGKLAGKQTGDDTDNVEQGATADEMEIEVIDAKENSPPAVNNDDDLPPVGYPRHVVLDCSQINQMDMMGLAVLKTTYEELRSIHVAFCFAGCNAHLRNMFDKGDFYDAVPKSAFFPSVADAVAMYSAEHNNNNNALGDEKGDFTSTGE